MTPPAPGRVSPLWVAFPRGVVHDIEVRLPDVRQLYETSKGLDAGPYHLEFTEKHDAHLVSLRFDFQTRRRRVESTELARYRDELDRASKFVDISLGPVPRFAPVWSTNLVWAVGALWTLVLLVVVALVQRHQPYLKRPKVRRDPRLARRGGWLWLVALGVTFAPLTCFDNVETLTALFKEPTWSRLTSHESPVYRGWFAPVTTLQLLLSITILVWACYCVYLFWVNRRTFPLAFIIELVLGSTLLVADQVAGGALRQESRLDDMRTFQVIMRVLVSGVWIGYCLHSRRVASLFVPLEEPEEPEDELATSASDAAPPPLASEQPERAQ